MSLIASSIISANPFEKHLVKRNQRRSWRKKVIGATLMLTSMVDMFSMLVVFLLQTFSSSPEILITKGVSLPYAATGSMVREAPVISLAQDGNIYLDQKLVGPVKTVVKKPELLLNKLELIKKSWAKNHGNTPFPGEINFQADEKTPSTTVSRVMAVLTESQFGSIELAILSGK